MNKLFYTWLWIIGVVLGGLTQGQLLLVFAFASESPFVLRVLTFNIQGLPVGVSDHDRYRDIGKILYARRLLGNGPHLVSIQEAFHSRTKELLEEAQYPYFVKGPGPKGFKLSSGLYILSEFPILESNQIIFQDCVSWDCMARKGVLHARIQVPGLSYVLEFFNTHLNSDPDSDPSVSPVETERVRLSQVHELGLFMKKVKFSQAPGIFAGDFNFHPGRLDYLFFSFYSNMNNATEECAKTKQCFGDSNAEEDWLTSYDHEFFNHGYSPPTPIKVIYFERNFKEKVNGRYLSDHLGLEIHYELQ